MAKFMEIGHEMAELATLCCTTSLRTAVMCRALTNATPKIPRTVPKNP